jgi:cell division protein FtsW (lipid II flippase)
MTAPIGSRMRKLSVAVVWLLLGTIMILWKTVKLKEKTIAHVTLVAFALILFAVVGTSVFGRALQLLM